MPSEYDSLTVPDAGRGQGLLHSWGWGAPIRIPPTPSSEQPLTKPGWPGQGHAQGPGLLPQQSPPPSLVMSPENPGSASEKQITSPRTQGAQAGTWSKGYPGALGKTHPIKGMGTTGFRGLLGSKYLGVHTQEVPTGCFSMTISLCLNMLHGDFHSDCGPTCALFLPPHLCPHHFTPGSSPCSFMTAKDQGVLQGSGRAPGTSSAVPACGMPWPPSPQGRKHCLAPGREVS